MHVCPRGAKQPIVVGWSARALPLPRRPLDVPGDLEETGTLNQIHPQQRSHRQVDRSRYLSQPTSARFSTSMRLLQLAGVSPFLFECVNQVT
jgi:hypothetical protein